MKRLSFLLQCQRNKGAAKESWILHRLCVHAHMPRVTFHLQACIPLRQTEFRPSVCSKTFLCMSFGRCSCGALPIHPGALHFNQYHIKFNTCFEMCTRSKDLPGDGGGGAFYKNTYSPSCDPTSNYLSPLAEPGELSTPAHCQPKERLWGQSRGKRLNVLGFSLALCESCRLHGRSILCSQLDTEKHSYQSRSCEYSGILPRLFKK